MSRTTPTRAGFTLIEVVLVIAIIAMMIVIIVPGTMHQRKRGRADGIRVEMKYLDRAVQQYALETGKKPGAPAAFDDVKRYLDPRSTLGKSGGRDSLGHPFGTFTVGSPIKVPTQTARDLNSVVDPAYWADYK